MINGMILCEGYTDQILIASYLEQMKGWHYKKERFVQAPFANKEISWYENENQEIMGIWVAGGNDFTALLQTIMNLEIIEHTICALAIVTDHDDSEAENERPKELFKVIQDMLEVKSFDVDNALNSINHWFEIQFKDAFSQLVSLRLCYLLVPIDSQGALETFMLDALSENSESKKQAIAQVKEFIRHFESDKYLQKRREKIKAELGVSISIFSPDRMFDTLVELIKSVDWTTFESTNRQFEVLFEI